MLPSHGKSHALLASIYHPAVMHRHDVPKKRDLLQEQQLVRDLWMQVEARIDINGALCDLHKLRKTFINFARLL
jgi:hypothetical protein